MQHLPSSYLFYMSNVLQEKSFGYISEDWKHYTAFAYEDMSKVYEHVKGNYHITFSDSCVAQYKNYKYFLNLCHHFHDSDLEGEWDFFATSHG